MKDRRLRASLVEILKEFPEINYIEEDEYFLIQYKRSKYRYYPEEGDWCNNQSANPTYYPCKSFRKFLEEYVLTSFKDKIRTSR